MLASGPWRSSGLTGRAPSSVPFLTRSRPARVGRESVAGCQRFGGNDQCLPPGPAVGGASLGSKGCPPRCLLHQPPEAAVGAQLTPGRRPVFPPVEPNRDNGAPDEFFPRLRHRPRDRSRRDLRGMGFLCACGRSPEGSSQPDRLALSAVASYASRSISHSEIGLGGRGVTRDRFIPVGRQPKAIRRERVGVPRTGHDPTALALTRRPAGQ